MNYDEITQKLKYIISVSESPHPLDTMERKIKLMVNHAKNALSIIEKRNKENDIL